MDAIVLIADNDPKRRDVLRHFFWESGFLVATAAQAVDCLDELAGLDPDVLVIDAELPGGIEAIIARASRSRRISNKPILLVIGQTPAESLSARSGVPVGNCFEYPVRADDLLDRAGIELALRLLRFGERTANRLPVRTPQLVP